VYFIFHYLVLVLGISSFGAVLLTVVLIVNGTRHLPARFFYRISPPADSEAMTISQKHDLGSWHHLSLWCGWLFLLENGNQ